MSIINNHFKLRYEKEIDFLTRELEEALKLAKKYKVVVETSKEQFIHCDSIENESFKENYEDDYEKLKEEINSLIKELSEALKLIKNYKTIIEISEEIVSVLNNVCETLQEYSQIKHHILNAISKKYNNIMSLHLEETIDLSTVKKLINEIEIKSRKNSECEPEPKKESLEK